MRRHGGRADRQVADVDVDDEDAPVYSEAFPALCQTATTPTQSQSAAAGAWYDKVASLSTANMTQVRRADRREIVLQLL